jgi:hypothetical protein
MLGTAEIDYNQLLMQMDSTSGKYEDAGEQSKGHKGASLDYRKIQNLVCWEKERARERERDLTLILVTMNLINFVVS